MAAFPKAVQHTIRHLTFFDGLRTYWYASIAGIVGFNGKNYGTCSRVPHDELASLARYYSRYDPANLSNIARLVGSDSQISSGGQTSPLPLFHPKQ